jgi:hypothetical protein
MVEKTQLVILNFSSRAKGIMPYIFLPDGTLVGLHMKQRREFKEPVVVYWLTEEKAYNIARVQLSIQELISHLKKEIELRHQQLRAAAYTIANKN